MSIKVRHIYAVCVFFLLMTGIVFFIQPQYSFLCFFLGGIMSIVFMSKQDFIIIKSTPILLIVALLSIIAFVASIIDLQIDLLLKAFSLFLVLLYFSVFFDRVRLEEVGRIKVISDIIIFISLLVIIVSLSQGIPSLSSIIFGYSGVFGNPNGMGMTMVPMTVIMGSLFLSSFFYDVRLKKKVIYGVLFILGFIFVVLSASRTSLIAVLLPLLIVFFKEISSSFRNKKRIYSAIFLFLIVIIIFFNIVSSEIFQTIIVSKFEKKMQADDMFSERDFLWGLAINHSKILGYNSTYHSITNYSPHNTFLSFLVYYGYVFFVVFIYFYLYILSKSYKYIYENRTLYRYIPFVVICSTLLLFMTEQLFTSLNNFATLIFFSVINQVKLK